MIHVNLRQEDAILPGAHILPLDEPARAQRDQLAVAVQMLVMGRVIRSIAVVSVIDRVFGIGGVQGFRDFRHIRLAAGKAADPADIVHAALQDRGPGEH